MNMSATEIYEAIGDALETLQKISSSGISICAECPWGRKCKTCTLNNIFKLLIEEERKLKSTLKKARGKE